jgi:two-component system KDP operon response regulator KdpE
VSGPGVLLVDDEPSIQRATATLLRSRGYAVTVAGSGADALSLFDRERPSLVILDLGLPDMDGTAVCRQLRERADVPILVVSVRGDERSKVAALDAGADDYVTKPYGPEELLARVRAGLRRSAGRGHEMHGRLERGELTIDFDRHAVYRSGEEIRLTPKELALLTLLASHEGRVLTHRAILKSLWGQSTGGGQEHLRVLVGQLRKKIEADPGQPQYILTEPWVGYRFDSEAARPAPGER